MLRSSFLSRPSPCRLGRAGEPPSGLAPRPGSRPKASNGKGQHAARAEQRPPTQSAQLQRGDPYDDGSHANPAMDVFKAAWMDKARMSMDTVQIIKVVFKLKLQVEFGESIRLIGGHEALGGWNLARAVELKWSPGDVWKSEAVELPVDGVFVYKYYRSSAGNQPVAWQQGNNQVLALSPEDAPVLEVLDSWRGDPAAACTSAPDGSRRMQAEVRLVNRVKEADSALREAQQQIAILTEELRHSKLQAKALREEARLGANVRLALKDQLRIEKKRNNILEQQVDAWREKALNSGGPPGRVAELTTNYHTE